jgi:hypothetical protein
VWPCNDAGKKERFDDNKKEEKEEEEDEEAEMGCDYGTEIDDYDSEEEADDDDNGMLNDDEDDDVDDAFCKLRVDTPLFVPSPYAASPTSTLQVWFHLFSYEKWSMPKCSPRLLHNCRDCKSSVRLLDEKCELSTTVLFSLDLSENFRPEEGSVVHLTSGHVPEPGVH